MDKISAASGLLLLLLFSPIANAQDSFGKIPGGFVSGNARIRILSPTLVRLEYSPSRVFTDSMTAVVVNRDWAPPGVSVTAAGGWTLLSSGGLTVRYRPGSGRFTRENLSVGWKAGESEGTWAPGDSDSGNLGGISSSLDGARRGKLPKQLPGMLSRSGYFLLDDSRTPLWNGASKWIAARGDSGNQDWYFFAYGKDFRHVLKEYARLCGPIPMIPKYVLGAWATDLNYEYLPGTPIIDNYHYTADSVRSIMSRFRSYGIPLDVMVLDFGWHLYGWQGSYDWSPIFQHPDEFMDWTRTNGFKVTLNDHPGYEREFVLSNKDSRTPLVRRDLNIETPRDPSIDISLHGKWKFRTDSLLQGDAGGWYAASFDDSRWDSITSEQPWEKQGYPAYDGVAWYRKRITVPTGLHPEHLYAEFGSVDDEYDIFINGKKVGHHSPAWNSITYTDVLPYVKQGGENLIVLRVNDWGGDGGVSGPTALLTDAIRRDGLRFNLAVKREAEVYMNVLHKPLIDQGVSFWWVDGGSGSCEMSGLSSQMWANRVFYDFTQTQTGKRSFIFSRYGGWGSHRYPALFTGDTYAQWDVLAFEVPYTVQGGNILMPYITHDIGGFIGKDISLDLYTRWLQFGVFSPLLRLHSAHENPDEGNVRMPWKYGDEGVRIARDLFRLRYRLLPYIYTMTKTAHDEALPLLRPLYIVNPEIEEAYNHPDEYYFGDELLVAPIVDSTGGRDVYLPPGVWVDYFSGEARRGPVTFHMKCSLETLPLFVRSQSIIPQQPDMDYTDQKPLDSLIVDLYPPWHSSYSLYEDDGVSLDCEKGKSSLTPFAASTSGSACELTIGPTTGTYERQPSARAYLVRVRETKKPSTVLVNGRKIAEGVSAGDGWIWDAGKGCVSVNLARRTIRKSVTMRFQ
jgi:alpha-glucosidase (family GH31 glycosyl hydrolase)